MDGCKHLPKKPKPTKAPVPDPLPPCDPAQPTWFCQRDPVSKSYYPTCNEVNYNRICCTPNAAYESSSKFRDSNCGKSRCVVGGPGYLGGEDYPGCPQPPPELKLCDDPKKCIEEAEQRAKNHKGNVVCKGKNCEK